MESGLARPGEAQTWTPLSGGVSSDIWRVDLPSGAVCVKRALPQLRVKADWHAPPERNLYEWRWFNAVGRRFPDAVPKPLAVDMERRLLAMQFLEPADHPLWKTELLAGHVDAAFAGEVGRTLGAIHAMSASEPGLPADFASDEVFHALRIEAYLLATAAARPEVGAELRALADRTFSTHRALVHGDVSPKNILMGPKGPVFLDAETAWWGDPAFDAAFCLNHLALKRLVVPARDRELRDSFSALAEGWLSQADWEPTAELEARAASLLPALMLARVDGKSPVEYLTEAGQKDRVRATAIRLLRDPPSTLEAAARAWDLGLQS